MIRAEVAQCRLPSFQVVKSNPSERHVIQGCHVFFDRTVGLFRYCPGGSFNAALAIGICRDETAIHGKAFTANELFFHAARHNQLEHASKEITLPEAPMTVLRKGRTIRYPAIKTEMICLL